MNSSGEKCKTEKCPHCGELYVSICSKACWCNFVEIPEKVAEYVELNYSSCVCKKCIETLTKEL